MFLKDSSRRLYHAIHLRDFRTYCSQRAILSRAELRTNDPENYTRFYTDEVDEQRGILGRTFGNIEDFGRLFWQHGNNIPNAYGPISLVFSSIVWEELSDIAVTPRGANERDFDLNKERLSEPALQECFRKVDGKWCQVTFGLEVSAADSKVPFEAGLAFILVEPITEDFLRIVADAAATAGVSGRRVLMRKMFNRESLPEDRVTLLSNLTAWARRLEGNAPEPEHLIEVAPPEVSTWLETVPRSRFGAVRAWLDYLYLGTLRWL